MLMMPLSANAPKTQDDSAASSRPPSRPTVTRMAIGPVAAKMNATMAFAIKVAFNRDRIVRGPGSGQWMGSSVIQERSVCVSAACFPAILPSVTAVSNPFPDK